MVNTTAGVDSVTVEWSPPRNGSQNVTQYRIVVLRGDEAITTANSSGGCVSTSDGCMDRDVSGTCIGNMTNDTALLLPSRDICNGSCSHILNLELFSKYIIKVGSFVICSFVICHTNCGCI